MGRYATNSARVGRLQANTTLERRRPKPSWPVYHFGSSEGRMPVHIFFDTKDILAGASIMFGLFIIGWLIFAIA